VITLAGVSITAVNLLRHLADEERQEWEVERKRRVERKSDGMKALEYFHYNSPEPS
jgi:hypothetical protein